jgi:hypothetical protein
MGLSDTHPVLLWSLTDARNGDSSRWYAPIFFGTVCLLLVLAGSTLLVHDHDDQGRHLHWLMHVEAEPSAQARQRAHGTCTPTKDENSCPAVSAPVEDVHRILISLPVWEVARERSAPSLQILDAWLLPALCDCAKGEHLSRAAPIRGPPLRSGQSGSGSQRILRSSHALRI